MAASPSHLPPDVSPIRGGPSSPSGSRERHSTLPGGPAGAGAGNLGALIAKVSVLQQQAQDIENDKKRLAEQCDFAAAERTRGKGLLDAANAELQEVRARVRQLVAERDAHVCSASEERYRELERRTKEARAVRMRVARKTEHLDAVLDATRAVTSQVQALRRSDVTSLGASALGVSETDEARAERDEASSGGGEAAARSAYIRVLLQKTGEQAVTLDRLRRAADNRDKLESECESNEARIRELRAALENAGAPVPEAPQMHRTKRLIARATQNAAAIEAAAGLNATASDAIGVAVSAQRAEDAARDVSAADMSGASIGRARFHGLNASAAGMSGVNAPSTSLSRSKKSDTSRRITLPVGTLRSVAQRAGHATIRDAARAYGVANLTVQVTETTTELHCSGALAALDAFHAAVVDALQSETANRHIDGLVTATDRNVALTVTDAVQKLAETVPVEPVPLELDDAVRRRVQFGAEEHSSHDDDDDTSTQATGGGGPARYLL